MNTQLLSTQWTAQLGPRTRTPRKYSRSTVSTRSGVNPCQAPGRYGYRELAPLDNVRVGGDDELPITAKIWPTVPAAPGLYDIPIVIMSSGFLLPSSSYASYAKHLASHGYAAIRYDLSEVMDDVGTIAALHKIIKTTLRSNAVGSIVDAKCMVLFGHSRGGKLSCLLANEEDRVKGLVLLDPVDNTAMATGVGYPSSLPGLRRATQARNLPVLIVGAAMNEDIIPQESNYKKFCSACLGPFWEVDLLGAGHLSFLDSNDGTNPFARFQSMLGSPPPTSEASVSAVTKVAATAWIQEVVYPYAAPSCGRTSAPPPLPPKELEQSLYNKIVNIQLPQGKAPRRSTIKNLDRHFQGAANAGSSSSTGNSGNHQTGSTHSSSSSSSRDSQGAGTTSSAMSTSHLCGMSAEQLSQLKARELKAGLAAAGVKSHDCFEKEQLVRRVLEACGKQA